MEDMKSIGLTRDVQVQVSNRKWKDQEVTD